MIKHFLTQFVKFHTDENFRKEKEEKAANISPASYLEVLIRQAQKSLEAPVATNAIDWKQGQNKIFGEVGKYTLFNIYDNNYGGGLQRYELEVKFSDRRWSSDSIDELKAVAFGELNSLMSSTIQ